MTYSAVTAQQRSLELIKILSVALLYFLFVKTYLSFSNDKVVLSIIWPASGFALATVLIGGNSYALSVLLGSFSLIATATNKSLPVSLLLALAPATEALLGSWLINRYGKFTNCFKSARDYLYLIILAGGISCFVGVFISSNVLFVEKWLTSSSSYSLDSYISHLLRWWQGDALGVILFTPLFLLAHHKAVNTLSLKKWLEVIFIIGIAWFVGQVVFLDWFHPLFSSIFRGYWLFLLVTFAAVRLCLSGTLFILLMTTTQALLGVSQELGIFAHDIAQTHLSNFWLYMVSLSVVGITLSIHTHERQLIEKKLRNHTDELILNNIILQKIHQGCALADLLNALVNAVEKLHPDRICFISLLNAHGHNGLINNALGTKNTACHSCKNAIASGECVVAEGACQSLCWPVQLKRSAVKSCWSQPIKNGANEVLGVFTLCHTKAKKPSSYDMSLLENYANLAQLIVDHKRIESKLKDSEEHFRSIFYQAPVGIALVDSLNGHIYSANQKYADIVDLTVEELQLIDWLSITHTDDVEPILANMALMNAGKINGFSMEKRCIRPDKSIVWVNLTVAAMKMEEKTRPRHHCIIEDISPRKQAETELRIAATAFESQEGMVVTDAHRTIIKVNHAFTAITGYQAQEAIGQTPQLFCLDQHDTSRYADIWQSIKQQGSWQGEIWNRRKNGEIYPQWLMVTAVKSDKDIITHYVGTLTDISERKAVEKQIEQLAFYDPLTQLPNRRLLYECLKHGIESNRRNKTQLAVLMLDLDEFKAVNDNLGHLAGDELLQQVAKRIKARLRDVDMVARLGGDEFTVLLEQIKHNNDAALVAGDIINALNAPFQLDINHKVNIGVSIGISLHPQHGDNPDSLIGNADRALYQAKKKGKACFAFFQGMTD